MFEVWTFRRLLWLIVFVNSINLLYPSALCVKGEEVPECPHICECNSSASDSHLKEFCDESHGKLDGRCCFNETNLIGLDLSNCCLSSLSGVLQNYTKLLMLELQNNSITNCSRKDFVGLVDLDFLYLPVNCHCPGGEQAWGNSTELECENQQNPCQYMNISCTSNGQCIHTGPGSAKCICLPKQHGYKCLKEGKFPTETFVLSLCLPTICLAFVLWYTQRRHINNVKQD